MQVKMLKMTDSITGTVVDYRPSTAQLQVKSLLPSVLLLTREIEVKIAIQITGNSPVIVLKSVISIVDYLYFRSQILL